jgi:membrane-bound lytic murein transglycosylase D
VPILGAAFLFFLHIFFFSVSSLFFSKSNENTGFYEVIFSKLVAFGLLLYIHMNPTETNKKSDHLIELSSEKSFAKILVLQKLPLFLVVLFLLAAAFSFQYLSVTSFLSSLKGLSAVTNMSLPQSGISDEEILGRSDDKIGDYSAPAEDQVDFAGSDPLTTVRALPQGLGAVQIDSSKHSQILSDYKHRIDEAFHISAGLEPRVQFWFDVYTKYGLDERVIHSQKYPWIILKVVDIAPIIYAETPKFLFLRNQRADRIVKEELTRAKLHLLKIAHTPNLDHLSDEDRQLVGALQDLPGKIQKNAQLIAGGLRIQTGQKEIFQEGLSISKQFLPQMEEIFKQQKLPTELARIPLVESSFNHLATSKAGASGVWQFIGNTGKKFLMVNNDIDERRSPIKSTYAAALLLKENHMLLKRSWPLAVTAYNHGPGGVRKAAHAANSYDLALILSRYQSKTFSFASSNYYTEFLGALYAEKYQDEIFGSGEDEISAGTQVVRLSRKVHATELLKKINMPSDDFIDLNPDLKKAVEKNSSLPKGFKLHIPNDKKFSDPTLFVKVPLGPKDVARND